MTDLTMVSEARPMVRAVEPAEPFDITKREYTEGEGTYIDSDSVHNYASGVEC